MYPYINWAILDLEIYPSLMSSLYLKNWLNFSIVAGGNSLVSRKSLRNFSVYLLLRDPLLSRSYLTQILSTVELISLRGMTSWYFKNFLVNLAISPLESTPSLFVSNSLKKCLNWATVAGGWSFRDKVSLTTLRHSLFSRYPDLSTSYF